MPIAAVALAAGSFAAGATAFTAATSLAATVAAGAVLAGSALTIVGTISGNQKLAKIGALVGLAGGLGTAALNLASGSAPSAGAAGSAVKDGASSAAETAVQLADGAAQTFPVPAPDGIETLSGSAGSAPGGGMLDMASGSAGASAAAPAAVAAPATPGAVGAALSGDGGALSLQPSATPFQAANSAGNAFDAANTATGQAGAIDAFRTANPFERLAQQKPIGGNWMDALDTMPVGGAISAAADPSLMSKVQAWAKSNPELARMALVGVGTAASNLVPSEKDKAMMAQYKAQTDAINRRARWGAGRV